MVFKVLFFVCSIFNMLLVYNSLKMRNALENKEQSKIPNLAGNNNMAVKT